MFLFAIVLSIIIGVYFYNTFVKFHIEYAKLHNQDILSQISEINNNMVKLSNSLFANITTNKFLNDESVRYDNEASKKIKNFITSSDLDKYVSDLVIVTPSKDSVFELSSNRKYKLDDFLAKKPSVSELMDNNTTTVCQRDGYVNFYIKDSIGHKIIMMVNSYSLSRQLSSNIYPLSCKTVVTAGGGELVVSDYDIGDELYEKITGFGEGNSVHLSDGCIIVKTNNSSLFSCAGVLKISEMFAEAFKTSSFLILLFVILLALALLILYLFYYKHNDILRNNKQISELNTNLTISLTMEKIFTYNSLSKPEEALLNRYFILCNASYFLPLTIDVSGISSIAENGDIADIMLYKYGFKNIISEIFEKRATVAMNDIDKKYIGVILYGSNKFDMDLIKSDARYIKQVIDKHFNFQPEISIGIEQSDVFGVQKQLFALTDNADDGANEQNDMKYENEISADGDNSFAATVKKCIEKNYSDINFCLSAVTEELGLSAHYFGRKFKNNFGISFNQYLTNYRLNHSVELLLKTNYSNKQISEMCGFSSDVYFISVFKKKYGKSPKQYKSNPQPIAEENI